MYGNSMQAMMPSYLEASMENFRANQSRLREAFEKGLANNPLARIHETNMAMMRAASEAFIPKPMRPRSDGAAQDEISALREQMAAMQKKLDELSR